MAARVAREARSLAGDSPDASAALARAAGSLKATLTPDDIALARADDAAQRLDSMIDGMRRNGQLQEFNRAYKTRRAAAVAARHRASWDTASPWRTCGAP
jgi:hypothetical protein